MNNRFLSVIIPAHNEQALIGGCLDSVLAQEADPACYEVILIDNCSTDRTAEIAKAKGVRVEGEPSKGYVHALRRGVAASRGDLLAFLDADCLAPATWVARILRHFEQSPEIAALGGKLDFYDLPPACRQGLKWLLFFADGLPGNNMVIRREALDRIGGINPNINLTVDYWLMLQLRKIGRIKVDRGLVVKTSGRRFKGAFGSQVHYLVNVLSLNLLSRPLFFDFPDVRFH
jgi:glycosyltransferase involved in cell wall biosynthesis